MRLPALSAICVVAVLGTAGVACSAALAAEDKETEVVNKTVPFPDGGTLKLKNFSGAITITGTSGRDVVMKATRTATRDRLDHIKLSVDTSGSTVTINANDKDSSWHDDHDDVVETTFEIQVPMRARLDVDAFSSRVDVSNVSGDERLHTFSGAVTVRDGAGAIDAYSFSGRLDVDAAAAGTSPDLSLETFSGPIHVRLANDAKGSVEFNSFSGAFDSDLPVSLHSMRKRSVSADLPGGSGHTLKFHTFSGDVTLGK
jgi:DUF4097 and DUF4098 domain-containing protein YvlB